MHQWSAAVERLGFSPQNHSQMPNDFRDFPDWQFKTVWQCQLGPCTYRYFHFPKQMENRKWKMVIHFPFSIFWSKWKMNKKLIRRWDSERELSLRRHCTRTKNAIDSCRNSATDRFLQRKFTKFSEITQCNGHYTVQGHSRSPMLVAVESSYTTSY